jgi:PAS domain S-box-containing protein
VLVERMQEGAVTLSEGGDILYCNRYFADMLRVPHEQMLGQDFRSHVHPADVANFTRMIGAEAAKGTAGELVLLTGDGAAVPANFSAIELPSEPASPRLICGVVTDLTPMRRRTRELEQAFEQLRAETAVRKAAELDRERLAALAEASPDFIGIAGLDGRLVYLNAAGQRLMGLPSLAAATAMAMPEFFLPEDRPRLLAEIMATVMQHGRWAGELRLQHVPTGTAIPALVDLFVLLNPATGEPVNLATITRDLTDQKRFEEHLRQSQKMEAVGQLTGGIAHDFNNLLTGIMGSLELLQTRLTQGRTDSLGRYIQAAMTLSSRAAAMTQRLLAFSRRQPLTPRAVNVNELVGSMEELLARTLGEQIALDFVLAADPWLTLCDANQLESALLNLAINARDAMPEGGRLTVQTQNVDASTAAAAAAWGISRGQYVRLAVADTGVGMPPEVKARAFDPFFTTKPIGQGTGLGLSMIYGFAKQSDGHARIASEPGAGTTVSLFLPRSTALPDVVSAAPDRTPVTPPHTGETVLVVEDEPSIRDVVVEVLHGLGCTAIVAADGLAGLRMLQSDARIDLLVTDVGLPGLDGRSLADRARALRPALKVLFMTGYAENPAFGGRTLEAGMQMITKPFAIDALSARVRAMIA